MTLEAFLRANIPSLDRLKAWVEGGQICIRIEGLESREFVNYMVRGNELYPFPGPAPKPEPADVSMGNL